jgi:hypothetical protein
MHCLGSWMLIGSRVTGHGQTEEEFLWHTLGTMAKRTAKGAPKNAPKKTKRELEQELEQLKSKNAAREKELEEEIASLRLQVQQQQLSQGITKGFVFSVSNAAKDKDLVKRFHNEFVCEEEWKGSFVAYKYYIEVVKGARRVTREPQEAAAAGSGTPYIPDDVWENAIEQIENEAEGLMSSLQRSTDKQFWEAEIPHSDILAKLMESALYILSCGRSHGLRVTHQYEINVSVSGAELEKSIRTSKSTTDAKGTAKGTAKGSAKGSANGAEGTSKLQFVSDVAVWMEDERRGRNWLASFEFKPSNYKTRARRVQAEMNAVNIIMHRKQPCICVDVAGSQEFSNWVFNASALVPNPVRTMSTERHANYVKSCFLVEAKGADGILMLAAGLLRGKSFFNDEKLEVLGPTVAVVPPGNDSTLSVNRVVKAYDRTVCCEPNIDLVRTLIDPAAAIWTSRDSTTNEIKLQLVETLYFDSDWTNAVPCSSFIAILRCLKILHDAGGVHGDVRLGNMLSCGKLVDLDYARLERYPSGLRPIPDGKRHPKVQEGIDGQTISHLPPDKEHDLYSMGAVMELFKPSDSGHESVWLEASDILQKAGDDALRKAMAKLGELDGVFVELSLENRNKIFHTGNGLTIGNP